MLCIVNTNWIVLYIYNYLREDFADTILCQVISFREGFKNALYNLTSMFALLDFILVKSYFSFQFFTQFTLFILEAFSSSSFFPGFSYRDFFPRLFFPRFLAQY